MATKPEINRAMAILFAAYPSANRIEDGPMEQFAAILSRTLAPYPAEVLAEMVNPRTGLIATAKFLPSIAEIKSWCDRTWDRQSPRPTEPAAPRAQIAGPSAERAAEIEAQQRAANVAKFRDLIRELRATSAAQELSAAGRPPRRPETGSTGPS